MFGLSRKERVAEAIRRAVLASLTGAYFHHSRIEALGLNKEAATWLYTEALAHQFYLLGMIFTRACANDAWATQPFFISAADRAFAEHESKLGIARGSLATFLLPRFELFQSLTGDQRLAGEHYTLSARATRERDPSANVAALSSALSAASERYANEVREMFGV